MTIGVCGPVDLNILEWELKGTNFPVTNAFPLTSHFINALVSRGYKVIAYTNSGAIDKPLAYETENLKVYVSQQLPQPGRRFFKFEIAELQNQIEQHPADFIVAFWSYEYAAAALKTGIPMVVSLHDVALQILLNHRDLFRLVRWGINYYVVTKAKYLIANSEYTYGQLSKKEKVKTRTIANFYPHDFEATIKQPVVKGNYLITTSMGFGRRKNVHQALRAFAILRKRFPTLEYQLLGAGMEENGEAHEFARKHKLEDGVLFLGPLPFEEVLQRIAAAKVLLHPSREESFGMVVLEAMVTGTAVVAGKRSGFIPHLLNYGKAGLLCDILSPEDIANHVAKLLTDKSLREEMERNARIYAKANYSEEVIITKHLEYYSKILGKPLVPEREPDSRLLAEGIN
ncbi:glycosyltransferase family 4 protein [Pontibacter qinzhouensis]|uniref:Glycosyltransferase family 4 protein n=1 Tax=Pontibacter qinzhouensis TaxID=2603253 RepID=A0A5C8J9Z3_9BACT|nr:glycosyltransferase family 4 protein [Pontibacter qinzhouensis]TXK33783.1 glycosyltransferase family 4 protein [Pontibacter qinzhouensis]